MLLGDLKGRCLDIKTKGFDNAQSDPYEIWIWIYSRILTAGQITPLDLRLVHQFMPVKRTT